MSDYADLELHPDDVLGGWIEADPSISEAGTPAAVDEEAFKAAMRRLATGVVMVTARVEDRLWGLTISACVSISAQPPQVLISLAHGASCRSAVLESGRFGLSILRADQRALAELGAVPGGPKYVDAFCIGVEPDEPATMIAGALFHLECRVDRVIEVADHSLIVGTVEAAVAGVHEEPDPGPLLYFDRTFHRLGSAVGWRASG